VDYLEYKRHFDATHDEFEIPSDCQEIFDPSFYDAGQYSWHFKWYLKFADNKFVRIWEHFSRVPGLQESQRLHFAYHYGPVTGFGKDGLPSHGSKQPVDIRIDNSVQRVHLHFGATEPHYFQEKVERLGMEKLDMFTFINRIFKHRATGKTLDKVFGFRII
jgi:hypothetical protein